MIDLIFLVFVALLGAYLYWGFTTLVGERWQVFATIPISKGPDEVWRGVNLTFYGLLSANAYVVALAVFVVLTGAVGVSAPVSLVVIALMLAVCIPASRWMAWLVERKWHSFTVGGAFFVGVVIAPVVVWVVNETVVAWMGEGRVIPVTPILAAMAIAYSFGEGLGRLGCISYGCCYGKPVAEASPLVQKMFKNWDYTFFGQTRKVAYAGGLQGVKLVPIQAVTAMTYSVTGVMASWLFLQGQYVTAMFVALIVTQVWRFLSEMLRADYRGGKQISSYQIMALIAILLAGAYAWVAGPSVVEAKFAAGLAQFWNPLVFLLLGAVWLLIFGYMGRSTVTEATVTLHVRKDRA